MPYASRSMHAVVDILASLEMHIIVKDRTELEFDLSEMRAYVIQTLKKLPSYVSTAMSEVYGEPYWSQLLVGKTAKPVSTPWLVGTFATVLSYTNEYTMERYPINKSENPHPSGHTTKKIDPILLPPSTTDVEQYVQSLLKQ